MIRDTQNHQLIWPNTVDYLSITANETQLINTKEFVRFQRRVPTWPQDWELFISLVLQWHAFGCQDEKQVHFFSLLFDPQQGAVLCAKLFHFCQRVWCGHSEITWIPQRKEIHHRGSFYCVVPTMYEWISLRVCISLRDGGWLPNQKKKKKPWGQGQASFSTISTLTIKLRDKHKWGWGRVDLVHSKLQSSASAVPERGTTRR